MSIVFRLTHQLKERSVVDEEGDFESGAWKLNIDDQEEEDDDEEEELEDNYVNVGDFSEDEDGDDGEERE